MQNSRKEIDKLDDEIVSLLKKRQEIVERINFIKKEKGIARKDSEREKEIITRLKKIYDSELVERIYSEIFDSAYN